MNDIGLMAIYESAFLKSGRSDDCVWRFVERPGEGPGVVMGRLEDGELPVLSARAHDGVCVVTTRRTILGDVELRHRDLVDVRPASTAGRYKFSEDGLVLHGADGGMMTLPMRMGSGCLGLWNMLRKIMAMQVRAHD